MADNYDQILRAAATMTREVWPDLMDKAIDVFWELRDSVPGRVLGQFFDVDTATGTLTRTISYGTNELSLPQESEDLDPLPYAVAAPGRSKTFTMKVYRLGVRATDTAFRTTRFDKILWSLSGLVQAGERFDEMSRALILDNAFSGTDGADSKPLCASDHPNEDRATGTWDNLGSGPLNESNLHAARLKLRRMTGPRGNPFDVSPVMFIVPPELEKEAEVLTNTTKKPDSAVNDVNAFLTDLSYDVSPYFSSTTAWFLFGNLQGEQKGLTEVQNMDWEISDNSPANVDIKIDRRIKAIKTFGYTISRNIVGSPGT